MSWYAEYNTVPRKKSQSPKNADPSKSKNNQTKKYHQGHLGKSYGERNSQLANEDNHVALATNGIKASVTARGSEGAVRLPSLGTVHSKGVNQPLAPPSTPETCHQQAAQDADSKTEFKNQHIKLPQIKITQDTTDYLKPPQGTSNSTNNNSNPTTTTTRPTLKSSTVVSLPSLSSKPKHQPKTAGKHWRKRVTVSWSEGGASRVVIEEDKKRVGNRETSRDKRQLTREHLRRFMMNERRELRKK